MQLDGFSAVVIVDGEELREYDVTVAKSGQESSCWIASEAGKRFGVEWSLDPDHTSPYDGSAYLDGHDCGGTVVVPGDEPTRYMDGVRVDDTHKRPFLFGSLHLTDEDEYLHQEGTERIGEICLKIRKFTIIEEDAGPKPIIVTTLDKVHEYSKKGSTHCIRFGENEVYEEEDTYMDIKWCDEPSVDFVFRYRPIDMLRANGIAPPPEEPQFRPSPGGHLDGSQPEHVSSQPQPEAAPAEGIAIKSEDSSARTSGKVAGKRKADGQQRQERQSRLARLEDMMHQMQAEMIRLRAEEADMEEEDVKPPKRIKTEPGCSQPKKSSSKTKAPEVIDLT